MVCPPWAAVLGSRTRVDADNRSTTNPLTGEPDAGNPPVRFGGRGKVQSLVPTPIPFFTQPLYGAFPVLREALPPPPSPCIPSQTNPRVDCRTSADALLSGPGAEFSPS